MTDTATTSSLSTLETKQRLSQSLLWQLQRDFFQSEGIGAWNTGKVPHYATSNPYIARAYGKVATGFLRDYRAEIDTSQPLYVIELGSGSGRFSYHFLKQFFESHSSSVLKEIPIKYIMMDFAEKNIEFWQNHPALRPFIAENLLDFACFDITNDKAIALLHSGELLNAQTLKNPLVVLANYFFDSIPQDLFTIHHGQIYETLLTITASNNSGDRQLLENLKITYTDVEIDSDRYYDDPAFNQVLKDYQTRLQSTALLFPCTALNGLKNLRQLSGDRLLFLSGDKGYDREERLEGRGNPKLTFHHGAFSLMANYPAIARYVENEGGLPLLPQHRHRSIAICAFLFGNRNCLETRHAYQTNIAQSSPDDFFTLKKALEVHFQTLSLEQILAYLRFSGWDYKLFLGCFDNLMMQVENISVSLRDELHRAIANIWEMYYFIGEEQDLPFHLSMLSYKMGFYEEAIAYLDRSLAFYGDDPGIFYNQAKCYRKLQFRAKALKALDKALELYPQFEEARQLKVEIEGEFQ
ncbi:MAG: SAM-dependent methyltransferase [Cyanobacteria bacterium P01_E01_bin.42]